MLRRMAVWTVGTITLAAWTEAWAISRVDHPASAPRVWTASGSRAIGPACAPVPSELVSWWRGDGDALDFTGTNAGTLQGNVSFATGKVGQAFSLNGGVVVVPDHATLDLTGQFTVEFWFNYTQATIFRGLLGKRSSTGVTNYAVSLNALFLGIGLLYNDPGVLGGDDYSRMRSGFESIRYFPAPAAGTFHHFAGTYVQIGGGIELRMYVDGQLVRSDTLPGYLTNTVNAAPLIIGASTSAVTDPFLGLMDEVTIYRRALSAEEVNAIYQAGDAGKCVNVTIPFAALGIDRARVEFSRGATLDRFDLWGKFELGGASDGITPLSEEVRVTFGPINQTIPAGAFVRTPEDDGFQFKSNSPGIKQLLIRDNGVFRVWATELDLSGMDSAQPVVFVLGIGNDEGSANIASAERLRIR